MVKESDDSVLVVALNDLLRIHPDGRAVDLGAFAPFSAGVVGSVALDLTGELWLGD